MHHIRFTIKIKSTFINKFRIYAKFKNDSCHLDNLTFIDYVHTFPFLRYTIKTSGFDVDLM